MKTPGKQKKFTKDDVLDELKRLKAPKPRRTPLGGETAVDETGATPSGGVAPLGTTSSGGVVPGPKAATADDKSPW